MSNINFGSARSIESNERRRARDGLNKDRDTALHRIHFEGRMFDGHPEARRRIFQAYVLARLAIFEGVTPTDLHWHGESTGFCWTDAQNDQVPMNAATMLRFGETALKQERDGLLKTRETKDAL